jgi:glycosyltransferase involved in cell wall biosynthesis
MTNSVESDLLPAQPPRLSHYAALSHRFKSRSSGQAPLVTLVTICRDAASSIERCISSVRGQDFQDYEHVVIDGDSSDGTAHRAQAALRPEDLVLSEPDLGISDAMNKGIALARGRFIQFLHADDWMSRGQLRAGVEALQASQASYVYGDLVFFVAGRPDFIYRGDPDYHVPIGSRMPALNHPTVLARKEMFERIGLFSLQYRCAMDYDFFLRAHRAGECGEYRPEILGCMNHDGVSNVAFRRTMREVRDIAVAHGRNRILAQCEFVYRIGKTSAGRAVRAVSAPAHRFVRRRINRSYRLLDEEILLRAQR